jgi:hypothetical protein
VTDARLGDRLARFSLGVWAEDTLIRKAVLVCSGEVEIDVSMPVDPLPGDSANMIGTHYLIARLVSVDPPWFGPRDTASPLLAARRDSITQSISRPEDLARQVLLVTLYAANPGLLGAGTTVALPTPAVARIQHYVDAANGFPSRVEGGYLRMLYLSAGITTGLTFGDVIPVTGKARFVTAVQAVVGQIFFGLFLVTITRARESAPSPQQPKPSRWRAPRSGHWWPRPPRGTS